MASIYLFKILSFDPQKVRITSYFQQTKPTLSCIKSFFTFLLGIFLRFYGILAFELVKGIVNNYWKVISRKYILGDLFGLVSRQEEENWDEPFWFSNVNLDGQSFPLSKYNLEKTMNINAEQILTGVQVQYWRCNI